MASKHAGQSDPELALELAIRDTDEIPLFWLEIACVEIRRNDDSPFFPPTSVIRKTAARLFRQAREKITGEIAYSPTTGRQNLRVDQEIDRMTQGPVANGFLPLERKAITG